MTVYKIESPDPELTGNVRGVLVENGIGYIPDSPGAIGYFTRAGWTITPEPEGSQQQPTLAPPE